MNYCDVILICLFLVMPNIPISARWAQNGVTIAGGHGAGDANRQLNQPFGIFIAHDEMIYVAEWGNNRITQWKIGDTYGRLVAGGHAMKNRLDQVHRPISVLVDEGTDSLIICSRDSHQVLRWSHRSGTTHGEILIDSIQCYGLAMDADRLLYVSDIEKHEVKRYKIGDGNGTLVAGGNGRGSNLNQLNMPTLIVVDHEQTVYVSDNQNHRVMKWYKDATEGIVVAGGNGMGTDLTQLANPNGLFIDKSDAVYVADTGSNRIIHWAKNSKQGTIIVGGKGQGSGANQLYTPVGIFFDHYGDLYVADAGNNRVQRFSIE